MRKLITLLFLLGTTSFSIAQTCATTGSIDPLLYNAKSMGMMSMLTSTSYCIDIHFQIVRNDDGSNAFTHPNLNNIIIELNKVYNDHGIYLKYAGVSYIDSTSHVSVGITEAQLLASSKKVSGAVNYFVVDNITNDNGSGSYNGYAITFISDALFIKHDFVYSATSAHELGHCFGLYHTFRGLGNGEHIYGCAESYPTSYPNCENCGDEVCDTPADDGEQTDNGYNPDLTNIMSYYHQDGYTRDHFTTGQGERMRGFIGTVSKLQNTISDSCYSFPNYDNVCYPQTTTFSISNLSGETTTWSVSSNVQITSSNNSSATIRALNSGTLGTGWIKAVLSNGVTLVDDHFSLGVPDMSVEVQFFNGVEGESWYLCSSHAGNAYELMALNDVDQHQYRIKNQYGSVLYTSSVKSGLSGSISYTPSPGWYEFEFRGYNDCGTSEWSSVYVEYVNCAAFEEFGAFTVFPNPASESLNIQYNTSKNGGNLSKADKQTNSKVRYELYNSELLKVAEGIFTTKKTIDVSSLSKGRYILKLYFKGRSESRQVVIE